MSDNGEIWEGRADKWGGRFTRHPIFWALFTVSILAGFIMALSFAFGWIGAATDVISPNNVRAQYHTIIQSYNALEAQAENVCGAEDAAETGRSGPTFIEDPALAYKATYRKIAVKYNTAQENFFEAKIAGPGGYPTRAPTLKEMEAKVC